MRMGLLRVVDTILAEIKCNPEQIKGYTLFYACTKDKCIIRSYDRGGTLSTNGKVYKLCMLFTNRSKFDEFFIDNFHKLKEAYKNLSQNLFTSKNPLDGQELLSRHAR